MLFTHLLMVARVGGILLLETKLYIPKWRPGLVSRPRLIERMHQGIERKLTLVSAPAGFGKTTQPSEASPEAILAAFSQETGTLRFDPFYFN